MEKILLVINSRQVGAGAISFACYIAMATKSALTGLIVVDNDFKLIPKEDENNNKFFKKGVGNATTTVKMDADQAMAYFKDVCHKYGVQGSVITDKGNPIEEIVFESRFADLLVVDPITSFNKREEALPSHFVKELVTKVECPIMVAPEVFEDIEEIIFCYDGSRSSAFAIKQFTYLFPECKNKNLILLEVKSDTASLTPHSVRKMQEWLKCHYSEIEQTVLEGDPADETFTFLLHKRNSVIVMGAYGRSIFSTFFRKSTADLVMKVVDQPLFIAHM
jgi:hypothetical protein